jgi:hypothetical protein
MYPRATDQPNWPLLAPRQSYNSRPRSVGKGPTKMTYAPSARRRTHRNSQERRYLIASRSCRMRPPALVPPRPSVGPRTTRRCLLPALVAASFQEHSLIIGPWAVNTRWFLIGDGQVKRLPGFVVGLDFRDRSVLLLDLVLRNCVPAHRCDGFGAVRSKCIGSCAMISPCKRSAILSDAIRRVTSHACSRIAAAIYSRGRPTAYPIRYFARGRHIKIGSL